MLWELKISPPAMGGWTDFAYGITLLFDHCDEAADVDPSLCEEWQERLPLLLAGYDDEDIFNMDVTALFFRSLPNKSMIQKSEEGRGGKIPKELLTISFCVSAAGEKEKPLVIWRCQRHRCFKGKDFKDYLLVVSWYANKKAWMASFIFEDWLVNFEELRKKLRNRARKVLLVLDNATCHAHGAQLKNVKLLILPPNTTSELQPLNHGVIKCFNMEYRQCALRHVIERMDGCESPSEISKKMSVGDAFDCIKTFWKKIGQEVITKCFVSCGISSIEVERQLDLFDESTVEDQLAELSKLAGIEYDPESFQHEEEVECFDDYSADWEERLLVNESAEGKLFLNAFNSI
ncbi:Tigger transposable element-derived protein 6 [Araneus ventricosus]|uniref:Tigger transposable element-derived protein 6 n=1 Tax=Araneus ventricosus TaxID=182803 RepID=A0A4Y2RK74_ARAVE|nr:Tigger transposable element-derived protein 6 [Araneus ventricosus]